MNDARRQNRQLKRIAKLLPQFKAAVEHCNALKNIGADEESQRRARLRRNTLADALRNLGYPIDEYWDLLRATL